MLVGIQVYPGSFSEDGQCIDKLYTLSSLVTFTIQLPRIILNQKLFVSDLPQFLITSGVMPHRIILLNILFINK